MKPPVCPVPWNKPEPEKSNEADDDREFLLVYGTFFHGKRIA
jgi:hypothetical protein